jgi:U4/U6 small nuclear ribonucleoprotein PRP3
MGAATKSKNKCALVWSGITAKRAFKTFRFQECSNDVTARKVLEAKGVPHFWDMVVKAEKAVGFSSVVKQ